MARMRVLWLGVLLAGLGSSGCCWWADKWCPNRQYPAAYPSGVCCPPPCCPPCVPYTPTTTGYPTNTTWSRPAGPVNNCCTP
jgi:hypothetical protein